MSFLQFTVEVGNADPEPYEDALFGLGALSVTLEDAADDPILEPAPGKTPLWPTVRVKAVFPGDFDLDLATALQAQFDAKLPPHTLERLADRAWEREWLKDFHPMRFGSRLWICPAGRRPDTPDGIIVDLDPGLAFGTGTHATTALCLEWLDARAESGELTDKSVIDYGCGSGILAIAALKLGARQVQGMDIDPQAALASRDNAARNGVAARLSLTLDATALQSADILVANILAAPLESLAPRLASLVKPGGHIVLSGILSEQSDSLQRRYRTWFEMNPVVFRDGWARLHGVRHTAVSTGDRQC